jgi:hypothetical protein
LARSKTSRLTCPLFSIISATAVCASFFTYLYLLFVLVAFGGSSQDDTLFLRTNRPVRYNKLITLAKAFSVAPVHSVTRPGIFVLTGDGDKEAHNFMQSPKSPPFLRRTKLTISDDSENEIYRYLASPLRFTRFATFCNKNVALFGGPGSKKRRQVQNRKDLIRRQLVTDVEGFIQELESRGLSDLASETGNERDDFVQSHQDTLEDSLDEEEPDNNITSRSRKREQVQTTSEEPKENSSMASHRRGSALQGRYGKSFVSCFLVIYILSLLMFTCCQRFVRCRPGRGGRT